MNNKEKEETGQRLNAMLRQITDNAEHIKNSIPDEDLMLICCLMAEIIKITTNTRVSR